MPQPELDSSTSNEIEESMLLVHQLIDFSEIALPVEARNRYRITDENNDQKYFAYELGGTRAWAWIERTILQSYRPFTIRIVDENQTPVFSVSRPFRFYFHRADIRIKGNWIGYVKRKFSITHKFYQVYDNNDKFICEIKGPFWKPWTFNIVRNDTTYGMIRKAWSGWGTEIFSDSDTFGIQFPELATQDEKKLLLASVFLIDFIYFEGNAGMNYTPDIRI